MISSNKLFCIGIFSAMMLISCVGHLTEQQKHTLYVANDYLIYNDQKFTQMSELVHLLSCDKPVKLFISPLVNTSEQRLSEATADFIKMCGRPSKIVIQINDLQLNK